MTESLVIIGQGMAAAKLVEEVTARGLGRHAIIVIGAEPRRAYNRVLLSSLLAGEVSDDDLELKAQDWWGKRGVTNIFGCAATAIDRARKSVILENGAIIPYSKLVIATGSDPIMLPKPGMDLPGVLAFRTMEDVRLLQEAAQSGPSIVIGGGLLGIEAAYGLAKAGRDVTLLHIMDRLMERQLDEKAAALLCDTLAAKGVKCVLGADTARIHGQERVEALELSDGRILPANLVCCAIGVKPRANLARGAGLAVNRGIVVDDFLASSDPDIFAIGECAEHAGAVYGLVAPAYDHARILAQRLCGDMSAAYHGSVIATNLKVSGVSLFSAGDFMGRAGDDILVYEDMAAKIYRKFIVRDGRLEGALLYGDAADSLWYLELIENKTPIEAFRGGLAFGRAACADTLLLEAA